METILLIGSFSSLNIKQFFETKEVNKVLFGEFTANSLGRLQDSNEEIILF